MHGRRAARRLAVAVLAAATAAGCGPQSPAPASPPAENAAAPHRIALVMKSLANEFFVTMQRGAEAHQQAHAAEYTLVSQGIKDETDVDAQVQLVEQMIAQGVQAIVIAPADSKALIGVCAKALAQGIVVVNIDNQFDRAVLDARGLKIPFVGPDNRKGAYLVAAHAARRLAPGDAVAVLEGAPNAFNAIERRRGFDDAIAEFKLNLAAAQTANWEMDKANQVAASIVVEHPGLKAIFCANDSMALGAVSALRAAGKLGSILVTGYDNIDAVRALVAKGEVLATADQFGDQIAVRGIEFALEALRSGAVPGDRETPVVLVDSAG